MATYNGERYIDEQLTSIASQTRLPDHVVLSDDGSSDLTLEIASRFSNRLPLEIIQQPKRMGYSDNFLSMMKTCTSDIVFLSDQDDVWKANKIRTVVDRFSTSDKLLLTHDITITGHDTTDVVDESYFSSLRQSCIVPDFNVKGCALAYKKELIDVIGWPSSTGWTHDAWLCLLSSALGLRGFIGEPLMFHRIHGSNVSGILFTERSTSKKWLRKLDASLWPSTELDILVSQCLDPVAVDLFEIEMRRLHDLDPSRTSAALKAVLRKKAIVMLQRSPAYQHGLRRAIDAFALFAQGKYLSFGNISGLLSDLAGKRS